MTHDHWTLTLAGLRGEPWPMPPALTGVVHQCRDEPLPPEMLADITDPTELSRCAQISRAAAVKRLQEREVNRAATTAQEG